MHFPSIVVTPLNKQMYRVKKHGQLIDREV